VVARTPSGLWGQLDEAGPAAVRCRCITLQTATQMAVALSGLSDWQPGRAAGVKGELKTGRVNLVPVLLDLRRPSDSMPILLLLPDPKGDRDFTSLVEPRGSESCTNDLVVTGSSPVLGVGDAR
jgi:hypothetical protein